MVSRLDRLFILLDTGSNESIRLAAAKQLGEVQRVQPSDLDYLLHRIKEYSSKSAWETRVAAGLAIKCILEHVDQPSPTIKSEQVVSGSSNDSDTNPDLVNQITDTQQIFQNFDLNKIVATCPSLLSTTTIDSEELEQASTSKGSRNFKRGRSSGSLARGGKKPTKEQLLKQRQLINKELGISMVDSLNIGVKSTDIISNDDLQTNYTDDPVSSQDERQQDARKILRDIISSYDKVLGKLSQVGLLNDIKSEFQDICNNNIQVLLDISKEYEERLFESAWEIRHGSSIALREIVRAHGKHLGRVYNLPHETSTRLNQIWLIDMALKAICVLALDRFNDFLFDQVVAPVRENAAQLLGCCVTSMNKLNAFSTIEILLRMLESSSWETRHGAILGLKYTLSVLSESTARDALKQSFDAIYKCLGDPNDDVSAEAAAALVPVKDLLIETIPERTPKLIKFLWSHLANLDDLTSSTSNIILLLASLITSNSAHLEPEELIKSIPKLWPILSHSSTAVRISVLKALITLVTPQKTSCLLWMPQDLLTIALRLLFQRAILENMPEVRPYIEEAWMAIVRVDKVDAINETERLNLLQSTSQHLNYWLCLTMQHWNTPIDRANHLWLKLRPDGSITNEKPDGEVYIASSTFNAETLDEQKAQIIKCRLLSTNLLGLLFSSIVADLKGSQHILDSLKYISDMFAHYLNTKSANQRMISGWAIESWARHQAANIDFTEDNLSKVPCDNLKTQLNVAIQDINLCYDELAALLTRLQQEARDFMSTLVACKIPTNLPISSDKRVIYNLNQILSMCELDIQDELSRANSKRHANGDTQTQESNDAPSLITLLTKRSTLVKSYQSTKSSQRSYSISALSSIACALTSWWLIPEKLKLVIDPLIDSIESESESSIQRKSVKYLVRLVDFLCREQENNQTHINAVLNRLARAVQSPIDSCDGIVFKSGKHDDRIIFLDHLQRKAELAIESARRQSSAGSSGVKRSHSITASNDLALDFTNEQQVNLDGTTQDKRFSGASIALNELVKHFEAELPARLPDLWKSITSDVETNIISYTNSEQQGDREVLASRLITNLCLLQVVCESLHPSFRSKLTELLPHLTTLLRSTCAIMRHQSSRCIGSIAKLVFDEVEPWICREIIPILESDDITARCGAIEAVAHCIEKIKYDSPTNVDVFVVNVLRRMSDQNEQVRLTATHCFGKLLSLMPLKLTGSKEDPRADKLDHPTSGSKESTFIEQLFNPKKLTDFKIPFQTKSGLRSYQQEGLNWLAFLHKFNLHGILCDEMGLGKTFMTICMVASDHYLNEYQSASKIKRSLPSLIVCPGTLVAHWLFEIEKFVPDSTRNLLNPTSYTRTPALKAALRAQLSTSLNEQAKVGQDPSDERPINLLVTSYDSLRNDPDFFNSIRWNYCVLDEGHIIKNAKTKQSRAVRSLSARHRLILSGTPIQNNVTELWSLFDLLMPGFLGSERQFNVRFAKPILQSRESRCSKKDLEAGALAMEALHRQVLPFILRRLKDDVLDDLPPKIIQDYYCEMSPIQTKLYEDFKHSRLCQDVTKKSLHQLDKNGIHAEGAQGKSKSHVFQALQYLKNVCNHPKLVLTSKHPQFEEIKKQLDSEKKTLDDINHSSKLKALKQLLIDCGIAAQSADDSAQASSSTQALGEIQSVVNQHRALVFCQVRSMVDIVENDLFLKHLPNITYLKLDGSVPPNKRQEIVSRFNNDPSIDVLLITTRVGGLGLNLTGADTVIFVEHDWNPTRDLQAMDRAHRIGQKKVVNVYRLITRDTLEEKIMGLQKFKTMVSNTVINQDNTGLGTMNVEQLLDLFDGSRGARAVAQPTEAKSNEDKKNNFMDLLPDLWEQQQYETEYDLTSFVCSLKN